MQLVSLHLVGKLELSELGETWRRFWKKCQVDPRNQPPEVDFGEFRYTIGFRKGGREHTDRENVVGHTGKCIGWWGAWPREPLSRLFEFGNLTIFVRTFACPYGLESTISAKAEFSTRDSDAFPSSASDKMHTPRMAGTRGVHWCGQIQSARPGRHWKWETQISRFSTFFFAKRRLLHIRKRGDRASSMVCSARVCDARKALKNTKNRFRYGPSARVGCQNRGLRIRSQNRNPLRFDGVTGFFCFTASFLERRPSGLQA